MLKELCNEIYRSANSETCVTLAAVFVSTRNGRRGSGGVLRD